MKAMYENRVNVLMMANMFQVKFVRRNCPVEAVQHLRSGNTCFYCTRRRPMYRYKCWVYTITNKRLYKRPWN